MLRGFRPRHFTGPTVHMFRFFLWAFQNREIPLDQKTIQVLHGIVGKWGSPRKRNSVAVSLVSESLFWWSVGVLFRWNHITVNHFFGPNSSELSSNTRIIAFTFLTNPLVSKYELSKKLGIRYSEVVGRAKQFYELIYDWEPPIVVTKTPNLLPSYRNYVDGCRILWLLRTIIRSVDERPILYRTAELAGVRRTVAARVVRAFLDSLSEEEYGVMGIGPWKVYFERTGGLTVNLSAIRAFSPQPILTTHENTHPTKK